MSVTTHPSADQGPSFPVRAWTWARVNLFSTWFNSILTIVAGAFVIWVLAGLVDWIFVGSVWTAESAQACRDAEGACWAIVQHKHRVVLFGTYPIDEQWRPALACLLIFAAAISSTVRRLWNWRLAVIWAVVIAAFFVLMWGGILGLPYVPNNRWGGLPITLILTIIGCVGAFPLAVALALGRRSNMPLIRTLCITYIELIRGVPLISLLFMASFMLPLFMPQGVSVDQLLRAQIAIILFVGAYLAEVIRGGLQAIPKGQYEAAEALGLSYWKKMGLIILPQALRITIPPMVNTFISMLKDTSLVSIISIFDLMLGARAALGDAPWRPYFVELYAFVALIYWVMCFFISRFSQSVERDLARGQHR